MADYPSYATLPAIGAIQPTITVPSTTDIDRINFYLQMEGANIELRKFYQKLQTVFSLYAVPNGTWTLTAVAASGSSAVYSASASVSVVADITTEVSLTLATGGPSAPTGVTELNRGNSYGWLEDVRGYFAGRYGASAWDTLAASAQEQIIITATQMIDSQLSFIGIRLDSGQTLEFPRFLRRGSLVDADNMRFIPREVFEAMCEQAWYIYDCGIIQNMRKQMQADGVSSASMGRQAESFVENARNLPSLNHLALEKLKPWISKAIDFNNAYSPYEPVS